MKMRSIDSVMNERKAVAQNRRSSSVNLIFRRDSRRSSGSASQRLALVPIRMTLRRFACFADVYSLTHFNLLMESLCLILHVKNYPRQGRNTEIPSQFFALTRETAAQFLSKTFVLEWRTEKRFCRVALALIGGLKHDGFQVAGKRFGEDVDVLLSLADVLCRAYVLLVTNVKVEPANAVVPVCYGWLDTWFRLRFSLMISAKFKF